MGLISFPELSRGTRHILERYSSDLVLRFHKVGGSSKDRLKKEVVQMNAGETNYPDF